MKFKIKPSMFEQLKAARLNYKPDSTSEIELEPIMDTASEAIIRQQLDQAAYDKGYKYGYAQGFHDGRRRDYVMGCDFGSKDGDSIVVAMKKPDGSIEIIKAL